MTYAEKLEALLRANANPAAAGPMSAYMKEQFPFLGIKTPERVKLTKAFLAENGVPDVEALPGIVRALWALPEREYHYAALGLLDMQRKRLTPAHMGLIEELIVDKAWWDTVDLLASHLVGHLMGRYPELITAYPDRWSESNELWLVRSAILFQLGWKARTDEALLYGYIKKHTESKEFFIRKAIGWALREYAKTNAESVRRFVAQTTLSPLSIREALKADRRVAQSSGTANT